MSDSRFDRRGFLSAGLGATGLALASAEQAPAQAARRPLNEKEKLARIASNTWPLRQLFKTRGTGQNPRTEEMKKKYGEITMLDFPQFTKDTFPGVTRMDLFSGLFGDFSDESMYVQMPVIAGSVLRNTREFDPSSASGKQWLDKLAKKMAATGTSCQHISNNAPRDLSEPDPEKRKAGVEVAKKWLDGGKIIGAKSMRVNSGGPRIAPNSVATSDYPKNDELAKYLTNCIESLKELADYGSKVGVKVTLENHWGLTANPINIRIIIDTVNSLFCEASPDFCNWEHEYLMYNGLKALAPYAHTNVHAKYWSRWKENDVRRSVKIMQDQDSKARTRWSMKRGRGTASKARSICTRKCWRRCKAPLPCSRPLKGTRGGRGSVGASAGQEVQQLAVEDLGRLNVRDVSEVREQ